MEAILLIAMAMESALRESTGEVSSIESYKITGSSIRLVNYELNRTISLRM